MQIKSLNEDCIRHIFKYLDLHDLYALSKVSGYFRKSVYNLNMKLSYSINLGGKFDDIKLKNVLCRVGHHIETLYIPLLPDKTDCINIVKEYCYNLKHIRLEECINDVMDLENKLNLVTLELLNFCIPNCNKCRRKKTIRFKSSLCESDDTETSGLRHLRLLSCSWFLDRIVYPRNLQCLTLEYHPRSVIDDEINFKDIAHLKRLKKLFLLNFSEIDLRPLFETYAENGNCPLQEIHFHMCSLADNRIFQSLSKFLSLEVLEMCKIFAITSEHLKILSGCKNLTHFRCFDCIQLIDDDGICYLMTKCKKLTSLEIYWCNAVTLKTVDKMEEINKSMRRPYFTFKVGGRSGINWNDSGTLPTISEVKRSTDNFRFEMTGESNMITCGRLRHAERAVMIYVDENDPIGEIEASFPYKEVSIRHGEDPRNFYDITAEELGRIIQLYDAFDDGQVITCILELIQGGELFERVIEEDYVLTEKACTVFVRQICEAVEFIHSKNILHLDLKPENVLCLTKTGNRIKIIDFGMARRYDPNKKLQILFGTPEFVAPEIVNFDSIGFYTDMWSIGVICYVLLSGLSPFMGDTDMDTMANVTIGKFSFKDDAFSAVSDNAKDFIRNLLIKDGQKRLSAAAALQHPWLIHSALNTELSVTKTKLKRYVIKKRWIKAVNTIIALRRMGAKLDLTLV
ncbi:Myosin light chain kinase, smooth muscle [Pseudolycoriella hygida]|uniref:Myosin light chain kinase, smooth muscle n=1 Tax=Pseudolycoriella hygida TaxID=35572 RepID=A0A9Q0N5L4_9DIPT|nr:Myosin light chain kinase, smooth muscle [Pseudolycoriella hygida]